MSSPSSPIFVAEEDVSHAPPPSPSPFRVPAPEPVPFSRTFLSHPVFSHVSKDKVTRPLLARLRKSRGARQQAHDCSSIAAHLFAKSDWQTALTFYTFDEALSVEAGMKGGDVLLPVRRQGECLTELGDFEDAVKQLQRCDALLQSLDGFKDEKRRQRAEQGVLICRGTALLGWSDDTQTPARESRERVIQAQQCYQRSLALARELCPDSREEARSKDDAAMLAGSYENLGNAIVQLLFFDNVELDDRRRRSEVDLTGEQTSFSPSDATAAPYDPLTASHYSLDAVSTATLLAHKQARVQYAHSLFDSALRIAVASGLLEYSVRSLHNLGTLYEKVHEWDRAIDFLRSAIRSAQNAAPRAVKQADRDRHELSTRSVLVHMLTRAGRYEEAVEEATTAVQRAEKRRCGLEDARNDQRIAEEVEAREVAIRLAEKHVAEREEAMRLEERRASLSSTDLARVDAGVKEESEVVLSMEAVVAAIPVLLSAVRELHKLGDLQVANARMGVRPMDSFERATQAAEKAISMQRAEVDKFKAAVRQLRAAGVGQSDATRAAQPDKSDELTSILTPNQHSAYTSLLDSLSRSYARYGNTRLAFFRQTTTDKSDSTQLRRSRELTLQAFEQAANTATTPLLRAYMLSRQAEVQFNSAVEHSEVIRTLRQALSEADSGGLVLMKERVLQLMCSALEEDDEAAVQRRAVKGERQKEHVVKSEQPVHNRADLLLQLQAVQRVKGEQPTELGRELSGIRQLDEELAVEAEEEEEQSAQEQKEERMAEKGVEVEDEAQASAPASRSRRSSKRQPAASKQRVSVARRAREALQAGRRKNATAGDDVLKEQATAPLLLLDEEPEDEGMEEEEEEEDDDRYDPTFVDPTPPTRNRSPSLIPSSAPALFARSPSSSTMSASQPARPHRSARQPTPLASPPSSPSAAATHYDTEDSDAEDEQLGARTAQVVSAMLDSEEKKQESHLEKARLLRPAKSPPAQSPGRRGRDETRKRTRRTSSSEALRATDDDSSFVVEDRVQIQSHSEREKKTSNKSRAPDPFSALPSRRSMREVNASGFTWRAVCAQLLADRERSNADELALTQSQLQPARAAGSLSSVRSSSSGGSRDGRQRTGSTGSRSSQQRSQAMATPTQPPRLPAGRVERELDILDAESGSVTTLEETQYGDDAVFSIYRSPPRSQGQSHSLPLAQRPAATGLSQPTFSDPIVAYRPLRSVSLPRHSVRYEVEDLTGSMPLVAGADDRSLSLSDEELSGISMLAIADELVLHIQRRTGRLCEIASISHRGELLGADHTALHIFQRHQQQTNRRGELPILSVELDHWKPVAMADCYRTLCQTSSSLRIHQLVLQQLLSSNPATTIHFPRRPPPTLNSASLLPLFLALRVDPGALTSLLLPPVPLQADAVAAFARSVCSSQAAFTALPARLAFLDLFPHSVFPPQPVNQQHEPLVHALSRLSHVALSGVRATTNHLSELIASLALLPSLMELNVADASLTDDCLPGLCFLLRHSTSLTRLNLSNTLLTAETSAAQSSLVAALAKASALTDLDLSHSRLPLAAVTALLPSLVRLQRLNLSSLRCLQPAATKPIPSSTSFLASALSSFYSGLHAQLCSPLCRLTAVVLHDVPDVAGQLCAVLCLLLASPACRLRCVELCNNGLSVPSVQRLLAVLQRRNTSLHRLVLDGNRAVSDGAVAQRLLACCAGEQASTGERRSDLCEEAWQEPPSSERRREEKSVGAWALQELILRRCGLSPSAKQLLLAQTKRSPSTLALCM